MRTHGGKLEARARRYCADTFLCAQCQQSRIGEIIDFIRYGEPPLVSQNHREGAMEAGVSVYELINGEPVLIGWYFDFLDRPKFKGRGKIVGWGSDGEPLVKIITVWKISPTEKI